MKHRTLSALTAVMVAYLIGLVIGLTRLWMLVRTQDGQHVAFTCTAIGSFVAILGSVLLYFEWDDVISTARRKKMNLLLSQHRTAEPSMAIRGSATHRIHAERSNTRDDDDDDADPFSSFLSAASTSASPIADNDAACAIPSSNDDATTADSFGSTGDDGTSCSLDDGGGASVD